MKPHLSFEEVALRRGGRLLFAGLSLALGPGDALHVAGPNGSGKSSLLRLAAGLLSPERGRGERSAAALADEHLGLSPDDHRGLARELPLKRALSFWGGSVEDSMDVLGLKHLAAVPVRLLSSGQ